MPASHRCKGRKAMKSKETRNAAAIKKNAIKSRRKMLGGRDDLN